MLFRSEAIEAREDDVYLLEEARELAASRSAIYQQNLRRYHSRKVNPRVFREGDLVLRLVQRTVNMHKLSPPWEGPFIVSKALHNDSNYLIDAQEPKEGVKDTSDEETLECSFIAPLLLLKGVMYVSLYLSYSELCKQMQ